MTIDMVIQLSHWIASQLKTNTTIIVINMKRRMDTILMKR